MFDAEAGRNAKSDKLHKWARGHVIAAASASVRVYARPALQNAMRLDDAIGRTLTIQFALRQFGTLAMLDSAEL